MARNSNGAAKALSQILDDRTRDLTAKAAEEDLHWQQWPDDVGRRSPWEVYRVPAKGCRDAIILSGTITGHNTHYWGNRTMPCLGANCIACLKGRGIEWHGYFFATGPRLETLLLFEIPATGAPRLRDFFGEHRSLRGCQFDARRRGGIKNGGVILENIRQFGDPQKLPKPPATRDALLRLWQLDRLAANKNIGHDAEDLALNVVTDDDTPRNGTH